MHISRRRWLLLTGLVLACATMATACEPSPWQIAYFDAKATYWSSEEGKIPPPEGDEGLAALSPTPSSESEPIPDHAYTQADADADNLASNLDTVTTATPAELQAAETQLAAAGLPICCHREWMIDRGVLSWSWYATERLTRWLADNGPSAITTISIGSGAASALGKVAGAYLAIVLGIWALIFTKAGKAAGHTNCLRLRFAYNFGAPYFIAPYDVESWHPWCRRDWRTVT